MSQVGNINTDIPNTPPSQEVVIYDRQNNIGNIDFDDNGFGTIYDLHGLIKKCHSIKIEYGALYNNGIFLKKLFLALLKTLIVLAMIKADGVSLVNLMITGIIFIVPCAYLIWSIIRIHLIE